MDKNRIVWIRHAEKLYNNGFPINGGKKHDSGIIVDRDVFTYISMLVDELVIGCGKPDKIIVSPFLRTRQTCSLICNYLSERYKCSPKLEYDTDIGEFLGFCKFTPSNNTADVENETRAFYNEPVKLGEPMTDLNQRVQFHLNRVTKSKQNVWVITHGIVISNIHYKLYKVKLDRPKPLEYIVY
jgi:broad specificity phosphatase PhoE